MARLLVGDHDCSYKEILDIFRKPSIDYVKYEWYELALSLDLLDLSKEISQDLRLNKISYTEVIHFLLKNWRLRYSDNATLGKLLKLIPVEWKQLKDDLKVFIRQKSNCWDDLDDDSKLHVLQSKLTIFGVPHTLLSLKEKLADKVLLEEILRSHLTGDMIQKSFEYMLIELDDNKIPDTLPYYIERKLAIKNKLQRAIFQYQCSDIFLIENIEICELSILARKELTDLSGSQCDNITRRFILLENERDFQKILNNSNPAVPVHRIRKFGNDYCWVSTKGSAVLITAFLSDEFEEISEESLVCQNLKTFNSRPNVFCGSPGMGKTSLLSSIATKVRKLYPDRYVVFLTFDKLNQYLRFNDNQQTNEAIKEVVANLIAGNKTSLCKFLVLEMLKNDRNNFEIFMDGFDEILPMHVGATEKFLKRLLTSKNTRVHMTSRLHTRRKLEATAGVVCFDLTQFNLADQTKAIYQFWTVAKNIQPHQGLLKLIENILDSLRLQDLHNIKTIGCIPLHCNMIGLVYLEEALRYLQKPDDDYQIRNSTKSVFDLYAKFMDTKFEGVDTLTRKRIRIVHWVEALKLLFVGNSEAANWIQSLGTELNDVNPDQIYKVGILQPDCKEGRPVFLHKTFAEFLLADFVNEHLITNPNVDRNISSKFIFESILATTKIIEDDITPEKQIFVQLAKTAQTVWPLGEQIYTALESESEISIDVVINTLLGSLKGFDTNFFSENMMTHVKEFMHFDWNQDDVDGNLLSSHRNDELANPTTCFFLNKMIENYVKGFKIEMVTSADFQQNQSEDYTELQEANFLTQRLIACASMGYKNIMNLLIKLCNEHKEMNRLMCIESRHCQELIMLAAGKDDVDFFQNCCNIVKYVGLVEFDSIKYSKNRIGDMEFEHTPLHEAARKGNFRVAEYLIKYYDERILEMNGFPHICFVGSAEDSSFTVNNKIQILELLRRNKVAPKFKILKHLAPLRIHLDMFGEIWDIMDDESDELDLKLAKSLVNLIKRYSREYILEKLRHFAPNETALQFFVTLANYIFDAIGEMFKTVSNLLHKIIRIVRCIFGINEYSEELWKFASEFQSIDQFPEQTLNYINMVNICWLSSVVNVIEWPEEPPYLDLKDRYSLKKRKVSFQQCLNFLNSGQIAEILNSEQVSQINSDDINPSPGKKIKMDDCRVS